MARTFIRQVTQIRQSTTYTDNIAAGATLQSGAANVEDDLNSLRSQVRRLIWADAGSVNWYDDIQTANSKKRAVKDLNVDLDDVEEKRLLFRSQVLTDVSVTAAQNWEILSFAGSEAPSEVRASGVSTKGAVCATSGFSGAGFAVHELVEVAGFNAIFPKNLVEVRDSTSGQMIQSSGRDVYGLLQAESTGVDGTAFDDVSGSNRVKISFVRQTVGLDDLEACPVADIAGKTINYSYVRRINFDSVPEQAFLSGAFVDQSASVDVTLDNAIDNQSGPVTQTQSIDWRISDTFTLDFKTSDGGVNLLRVMPNVAGDEIEVNVDTLDVNTVQDVDFSNALKVDTAGTEIDIGVTAGYVSTPSGDFGVRAAGELFLDDGNQTGSTWAQTGGIKLSETTAEWDTFETKYGEVSLLNALNQAANLPNTRGTKGYANCTSTTTKDNDVGGVGGGTNLDAQLPNMSIGTFLQHDVFLNGELLRGGANAAANNDYYPGTSLANGQLMFEFTVHINDVLCVVTWS